MVIHLHTNSFTDTSQYYSDTKSSMNNKQFDTLDSSVAQYDPILTLSLNVDLPLPLTDMMTHIMLMTHKTVTS